MGETLPSLYFRFLNISATAILNCQWKTSAPWCADVNPTTVLGCLLLHSARQEVVHLSWLKIHSTAIKLLLYRNALSEPLITKPLEENCCFGCRLSKCIYLFIYLHFSIFYSKVSRGTTSTVFPSTTNGCTKNKNS